MVGALHRSTQRATWWEETGKLRYPEIYRAARCYLWVRPIVTECDSVLSVMGHKYCSRQASMSPEKMAVYIFVHCNIKRLDPQIDAIVD